MSRKDRVYETLLDLGRRITWKDVSTKDRLGFTAEEVGERLGIIRSNASRELNRLFKEGRAVRIEGRPVLFLARDTVESFLGRPLTRDDLSVRSIRELFRETLSPEAHAALPAQDITEKMIGSEGSLKMQVEQAKAAVLYPPRGLHTLIIGPTGTGKSTFAEMMYQFALEFGRLRKNAPFVVFNCADYADNPQLLLSQLFGHVRGAFTGADRDKPGLVARADGGVLFLDEVHRLPPEGQEMLFQLLDKGSYRRLGESDAAKRASVFLIAATTEDPNSVLLETFLRRIPMIIRLPSLRERPITERARLIKQFFREEVHRVRAPILVDREVLKALLLYECRGNIGQLKSDIQLLCARAFLNYMTQDDEMLRIDVSLLGDHLRKGLLESKNRKEIYDIDLVQKETFLFSKGDFMGFQTKSSIPEDFYCSIGKRWRFYQERGLSQERIREIVSRDIERYFDNLLKSSGDRGTSCEELFKVVSPRIFRAVEMALKVGEEKLGKRFEDHVKFGLAIHISTLIERLRQGKAVADPGLEETAAKHPLEFQTARLMKKLLEEELQIHIPKSEVGFIAMFLYAAEGRQNENEGRVGIVVMAHGNSTASSMLEVAKKLLGVDYGVAVDMPLSQGIEETLEQAVKVVKEADQGKGVLLLVDMGSLAAFPEIITERTGIPVRAVKMVSTAMVIEAIRKAMLPSTTLDSLVRDITDVSPLIGEAVSKSIGKKEDEGEVPTVLATCITGEGTAKRIIALLRESLPLAGVKMRAAALKDREAAFTPEEREKIVAVVGTVDLKLPGVPYIPLDEVIAGSGIKRLGELLGCSVKDGTSGPPKDILMRALDDTLIFLNPRKVHDLLLEAFEMISVSFDLAALGELKLKFLLHSGCMLERLIRGESLSYTSAREVLKENPRLASVLDKALERVSDAFAVNIPDTEKAYLVDLINTHRRFSDTL